MELSRVKFSKVRSGGISSPELGEAQGLVGFPVQGLVAFFTTTQLQQAFAEVPSQ